MDGGRWITDDNVGPVGALPDAIVAGTFEGAPMVKGLFVFRPFPR